MREGESEEEAAIRFRRTPDADVFGVAKGSGDAEARLRSLLDDYRFDAKPVRFEREGPTLPPGLELPEGAITTSLVLMDFGIRDSDRIEVVAGLETDPDGRREVVQKTTWLSGVVVLLLIMAFVALLDFLLVENVSREDEQHIRIAIGATPVDVFRQSVAENGVWIVVVAVVGWFAFRYVLDVLLGIEPFASYVGDTSERVRLVGIGVSAILLIIAFMGSMAASHRRGSISHRHPLRLGGDLGRTGARLLRDPCSRPDRCSRTGRHRSPRREARRLRVRRDARTLVALA